MSGIGRITKERLRQINEEGWTGKHDDEYAHNELLRAASCYIGATMGQYNEVIPEIWPWDFDWWKPSEDKIRNLEKAGALIAAEIDRLQREGK